MIRYDRGTLESLAPSWATVRTAGGLLTTWVPVPVGEPTPGTPVVVARTEIHVGIETEPVLVLLGRWPAEAEDPAGPRGLALAPVVTLRADLVELARAGALRAGATPTVLLLPGDQPLIGLQLLVAIREGVDVVLVPGGDARALSVAHVLGGRPIAAIPLTEPDAAGALLDACPTDVHVPVPSVDDPVRTTIRTLLARFAPEDRHHVVEVDPRPAFDQLGLEPDLDDLDALEAAAAGVLAGRLAARNRRWRQETDP